eukprot:8250778-Pyramimonas_sp.AAC.1
MVACQTYLFARLRHVTSATVGQTYRSDSMHGLQKDAKGIAPSISTRYATCSSIVTGRARPALSWSSSA